ncbi:hypothetical protein BDU57DRAFT_516329 [Ampelomyces quisqualis]|uniref:Uncharacterized protein n=1 Tax=Ampelomyces quisqualis TaxID=50730 RepID=A0A6A5QQK1_AMPQU|nr:hypothetical protein BDU57DRAFT_516329 [Ampelomyces quisqualis]
MRLLDASSWSNLVRRGCKDDGGLVTLPPDSNLCTSGKTDHVRSRSIALHLFIFIEIIMRVFFHGRRTWLHLHMLVGVFAVAMDHFRLFFHPEEEARFLLKCEVLL